MSFDLGSLLQQYANASGAPTSGADDHYQQVAQHAPADLLTQGLSAMFRSDQTPAFGQTTGQLFGQANPQQQAGLLNQILGSLGPAALSSVLGGAGGGALGGLLARIGGPGGAAPTVTADQASSLSPEQVQDIAERAEQHNPGLIDRMSSFYAEHPGLVKTLGSAALAVAMAKMSEAQRNG